MIVNDVFFFFGGGLDDVNLRFFLQLCGVNYYREELDTHPSVLATHPLS